MIGERLPWFESNPLKGRASGEGASFIKSMMSPGRSRYHGGGMFSPFVGKQANDHGYKIG